MRQGWTIGEVAQRTGMATSALRYYEAAGALRTPQREHKKRFSHRRYDDTVFLRVALIQCAQAAGFSVSEIALLVQGVGDSAPVSEHWRDLAETKLPQVEELIARATEVKHILETGLADGSIPWEACPFAQQTAAQYQQSNTGIDKQWDKKAFH